MNRRDTLTFLGLVGSSSVALATENMVDGSINVANGSHWSNNAAARALRRLADGIEAGKVDVCELTITSGIKPDAIITQKLLLEFNLPSAFEG
jgi:hypothetical protein